MFFKKTSSLFLVGSLVCSHAFSNMPGSSPVTYTPNDKTMIVPSVGPQKPAEEPKFNTEHAKSLGFKVVKEKNGESRLTSPQGSKILLGKNEEVKEVETTVNGNNIKLSLSGPGLYEAQVKGSDGQLKTFHLKQNQDGLISIAGNGMNYTAQVIGDSVFLSNHSNGTTQTISRSSMNMDSSIEASTEAKVLAVLFVIIVLIATEGGK
jgi:hypothetical protein